MDTDFLDWALADFSGYVAADELYDGPFCILSAVDNRRYKRILYDVLITIPPTMISGPFCSGCKRPWQCVT